MRQSTDSSASTGTAAATTAISPSSHSVRGRGRMRASTRVMRYAGMPSTATSGSVATATSAEDSAPLRLLAISSAAPRTKPYSTAASSTSTTPPATVSAAMCRSSASVLNAFCARGHSCVPSTARTESATTACKSPSASAAPPYKASAASSDAVSAEVGVSTALLPAAERTSPPATTTAANSAATSHPVGLAGSKGRWPSLVR